MKTNARKLLALMLAVLMLLSVCACAKPVDPTDGTTAGKTPDGTTVPTVKNYWEMLDEVSDTSELPDWTGETLEVTIWVAGGTEAAFGEIAETNVTFKELERVTGVKFNIEDSYGNGGDSIDAKLPKVIASGDLPTMIYGWNIDTQMYELFENGYLADLTEYYQDGSLDQLLELYPQEELHEVMWSRLNGKFDSYFQIPAAATSGYYGGTGYYPDFYDPEYFSTWNGTPSTAGGINFGSCMYVRSDILEKLYPDAYSMDELTEIYMENGEFTKEQIFDIPLKSTEDVVEFWRDIKDLLATGEYLDINGKPMEVTYGPNSSADNWDWMQVLPRIISDFSNGSAYFSYTDMNAKSEDQVVQWAFSSDKYYDYYKVINGLVNEDIIAQNSLVDDSNTFSEKYNAAHYAVVYGSLSPAARTLGEGQDWYYRPVWVQMPTDLSFQCHTGLGNLTSFGIFKDTLTDEQLDQLIHAINYLYSEVGTRNFIWGPASAGLFTEDENGNRNYVTDELTQCMVYNVDNGENVKYGLMTSKVGTKAFNSFPIHAQYRFEEAALVKGPEKVRVETDVWVKYCPGVFAEYDSKLVSSLPKTNAIYGIGASIEGCAEFWAARAGFEAQMKKMLAANPDKFEAEYQALLEYAEENGLTEETRQAYNDLFVEANRQYLVAYGVID